MPQQSRIQWLESLAIEGFEFKHGDNGVQQFYEIEDRGIRWCVFRCHGARNWVAICDRNNSLRNLNCCVIRFDGQRTEDPLYQVDATGRTPVVLLKALVNFIQSVEDPFRMA
ncbi:MAG: hypothetical protein KME35_24290 [Aphanocapsa sp. GSE-SYN-MK-11-07L]|nr:hypothetical protein [Aphanocapsa sp. GSE-SYN-MK-11-07L]